MTVERRIQVTAGVLILFVLGTGLLLFWSSRLVENGIRGTESTSQAVRSALMMTILFEQHVLHGDKRTLRQWDKYREILGQILNEMNSESIDRLLLTDLKNKYRSVNSLSPQIIQMASRESDDERQDRRGKEILTNLMLLRLEKLVTAANGLSIATQTLTLNRRNFVQEIILAIGVSMVLIILINIYLIRKSVVHPLKELSSGAERIGAGKFDYLTEIRSDDEVGNLARAFNTMIERLRKRDVELTEARDELELRVEERDAALQTQATTIDFLQIANESRGTEQLIRAATTFFQQRSGCEAVGIRLQEGGDYPYFEARGFPEEFILLENNLCTYDEKGQVLLDSIGNSILECMCGNVIRGRFDPSKPFFTERGSFWTNCTTDLLASTTEEDRQSRTRNRCNGEGYESVALIPLRTGDERWGLLQLNDKNKGRFTQEDITLWERLAQYLSVALAKCKAEEGLKEAKEHLEIRVQERTAELEEANRTLQEEMAERLRAEKELIRSNQDLQQFAYVASHDLQEPLRNVASCMQMLEKKYKNKLDANADQYIHHAVESSVRMKALILDLLAYSRIGTKGKPPQQVHCEQILDQTVKNLRSAVAEAGAVITHDPLPTIPADDSQLLQVFQNLIGNAIKFHSDGPPQIHVSAVKNKKEWIFSVKDNGIGIESRHLDRIFVIFQRLHKRSQYEGTGMGLAIVKKVVERHGGRVWVESAFGSGTTFYFTIPSRGMRT